MALYLHRLKSAFLNLAHLYLGGVAFVILVVDRNRLVVRDFRLVILDGGKLLAGTGLTFCDAVTVIRVVFAFHDEVFAAALLSGKLEAHLEEIDRSAEDMFLLLVDQMAACEGVTEELKAQNQMLWAQRMNGIRDRATETVNHDLIFA